MRRCWPRRRRRELLRTGRLRADTTVVPANVAYPTDSGLLARAVRRIAATGRRIQAAGGATRTRVRDRSRSAGKRAHAIASKLGLRGAQARGGAGRGRPDHRGARRAGRAGRRGCAAAAGQRAAGAAPRPGQSCCPGRRRAAGPGGRTAPGRLRRAVNDLAGLLEAAGRIAAQTRQRLAGNMPDGATRRVSLHDRDARPIAKGSLGKPVQFGYKAQVTDNDDGIVLDHALEQGNPADAPQLAPAVARVIKRTGRKPRTVTADRGYGEKPSTTTCTKWASALVVIPRKGKPGKARQAAEHRPAFRRTVKWRTGSEGRISTLKRQYGWDRTRLDGPEGARTWTGHGILAHNLVKIAALAT